MHRLFFRPPDFVRVIDVGVGDDDILRPNQLIGHQKLVLDSLRHTFNDNRLRLAPDGQANKRKLFHDADRAVFRAIFRLRAVRINPARLGARRFGVGADSGGIQRRGDCSRHRRFSPRPVDENPNRDSLQRTPVQHIFRNAQHKQRGQHGDHNRHLQKPPMREKEYPSAHLGAWMRRKGGIITWRILQPACAARC